MNRGYYVDKMGVCLPRSPEPEPWVEPYPIEVLYGVLGAVVTACLLAAWLKGLL